MHFELKTLQLIEPFRIAHGTSATRQVLRATNGTLVTEAPFVPYYGEDPAATLALLNQTVLPLNLPRTATLALNLLRHDIVGHQTSRPLSSYAESKLGAPVHPAPPGCRSFSIPEDLGAFAEKVAAIAAQFPVLKLKLGSGDLGLDIATVSVARMAAPDAQLLLDVNGGWDIAEAPLMVEKVSEYSPALIEQPIHHRHGVEVWEELRTQLPGNAPPIFADESIQNVGDVEALADFIDGINIKLLKCGSLDAAVAMISAAQKQNLQILLGCMIETSLGTTAAAHLAPWADWIDLDGHFYVANDDYTGITYDAKGRLIMPERPGIGAIPR
ncbi:enolase C-terminal domain-like protein [Prosthecobacter vanneervenii]|uniref:L-alanine-DL-glutamate epimerase-like enolase superfamily enzyme n=1 Tax=Prosthecobacter vanneervenii TaxID=48466 RepID=A0A7W8DJ23_9BACT|nr:enolase C-terminal domain-like protein [Prosthecobacter vanneervenii]MBB5031683.1 L-alanine-DL-glutamate epimerase-like enolase superfamily enzyme [Prosthecobacter vanneervenii]